MFLIHDVFFSHELSVTFHPGPAPSLLGPADIQTRQKICPPFLSRFLPQPLVPSPALVNASSSFLMCDLSPRCRDGQQACAGGESRCQFGQPRNQGRKSRLLLSVTAGREGAPGTHKLRSPSLSSRGLKVSPHIMRWRQGKHVRLLCVTVGPLLPSCQPQGSTRLGGQRQEGRDTPTPLPCRNQVKMRN